jgi:hypothetical protein
MDEEHVDLTDEELAEGEEIAIPAGDITGALTGAIESVTGADDDEPKPKPEVEVEGDPQAPPAPAP